MDLETKRKNLLELLLAEEGFSSKEKRRIRPIARDSRAPLSFAQQRLWFLDQLDPQNAAYNVLGVIDIEGEIDARILRDSFQDIVQRHEVLHTFFPGGGRTALSRACRSSRRPSICCRGFGPSGFL